MRSSLQGLPVQSMEILTIEQLTEAWARSESVEFADPALARTPFHLTETFFPLGFPFVISTNCQEVLDAAAERWGGFDQLFDTDPIRIDIGVTDGGKAPCPPAPSSRLRGHLYTTIADAENFATIDLLERYSLIWITRAALEHGNYFSYFFLESTAMCFIATRNAVGVHAACVELDGTGILLCGDSGAGKSTLSYACARAGWTYITDDASYLVHGRKDRLVVGNCNLARFRPASRAYFPELTGQQIVHRSEKGKPSIELAIADESISTAATARIRHIVFLNRFAKRQELMPFPAGVARLYMLQRLNQIPLAGLTPQATIDHLLECGTLELRYTDLDWAVERLGNLAREGW
jgi:hypothetical protein